MTNEQFRQQIREFKEEPSPLIVDGMRRTLRNLPARKRRTLQDKVLMASSIAAAVLVFLVFAGPPIVKAAGVLMERLFSDFALRYELQLAMPDGERLEQSISAQERMYQNNQIDARGEFFGVGANIDWVTTSAEDPYDPENTRGTLSLTLVYDQIPAIDPNYVDFALTVEGREIPMIVGEGLADYRQRGVQTLTEAQWAEGDFGGERAGTNSMTHHSETTGAVTFATTVTFPLDPWFIEHKAAMELRATVDGKTDSLAFIFDPAKAHALAVQDAKRRASVEEAFESAQLEQFRALDASAVPVGISGSNHGLNYTLSELSVGDDTLTFSYSVSGIKEKNPHEVDFWLDNVNIDVYMTCNGSGAYDLKDGVLSGVRSFPLGRDPRNLPAESLIMPNLLLRVDPRVEAQLAFRYNWQTKTATLPKDAAEMDAWIAESKALTAALYQDLDEEGTIYAVQGGEAQADGARLRVTSAELSPTGAIFLGEAELDGVTLSEEQWYQLWNNCQDAQIWVDGLPVDGERNMIVNSWTNNGFHISCTPPVNAAEILIDMPIRLRIHLSLPEAGIDKTIETEFFIERLRP